MGKFWKCFLITLVCMLMMCSCGKAHTPPVYEVVTGVDVVTARDGQLLRRHYTTSEKMRPVLLYLRMLKHSPLFEPIEEPEGEDIFLICVELTGGKKRYYRQAKHRYFSFEGGPWRSIDPGKAVGLYRILERFPSDEA